MLWAVCEGRGILVGKAGIIPRVELSVLGNIINSKPIQTMGRLQLG